eukprot:GHVL01044602.1.p1 GENE.GHVL01044602.1~~GHVL01044602.1.p1  ORF type:complete len:529 (+),score=111.77 GHVL01044602.1:35-1588(+)
MPDGAHRVLLFVYDHTAFIPLNQAVRLFGSKMGAYHVGVVVHGIEYCYGSSDQSFSPPFELQCIDFDDLIKVTTTSGICGHIPGMSRNGRLQDQITLGYTYLSESKLHKSLKKYLFDWQGTAYNLLGKNCIHFADFLAKDVLKVNGVPEHIKTVPLTITNWLNYTKRDRTRRSSTELWDRRDSSDSVATKTSSNNDISLKITKKGEEMLKKLKYGGKESRSDRKRLARQARRHTAESIISHNSDLSEDTRGFINDINLYIKNVVLNDIACRQDDVSIQEAFDNLRINQNFEKNDIKSFTNKPAHNLAEILDQNLSIVENYNIMLDINRENNNRNGENIKNNNDNDIDCVSMESVINSPNITKRRPNIYGYFDEKCFYCETPWGMTKTVHKAGRCSTCELFRDDIDEMTSKLSDKKTDFQNDTSLACRDDRRYELLETANREMHAGCGSSGQSFNAAHREMLARGDRRCASFDDANQEVLAKGVMCYDRTKIKEESLFTTILGECLTKENYGPLYKYT